MLHCNTSSTSKYTAALRRLLEVLEVHRCRVGSAGLRQSQQSKRAMQQAARRTLHPSMELSSSLLPCSKPLLVSSLSNLGHWPTHTGYTSSLLSESCTYWSRT